MWDWSLCDDPAARFENRFASQLLKYCHHHEDTEVETMSLRFLRDSAGREVDFVVVRGGKPVFAVECNTGSSGTLKSLNLFLDSHCQSPLGVHLYSGPHLRDDHILHLNLHLRLYAAGSLHRLRI